MFALLKDSLFEFTLVQLNQMQFLQCQQLALQFIKKKAPQMRFARLQQSNYPSRMVGAVTVGSEPEAAADRHVQSRCAFSRREFALFAR